MCRGPGSLHCHAFPNCGAPQQQRRIRSDSSPAEQDIIRALARLRTESGSHAPSVGQLETAMPGLVQIDACFLANPYATTEVLNRLQALPAAQLTRMVAHYPSQASVIAKVLAPQIGVPAEYLCLANGASEVIGALLARSGPLLLSLPTFSAYHEFAAGPVMTLQLQASEHFRLDLDRLEAMVRRHSPDTVVIINPNNPDGGHVPHAELVDFVRRVHHRVDKIIVDESFSHFAGEGPPVSLAPLVPALPHLIVINSLSKSHGIAGLRVGYAVMSRDRVETLQRSALWNLNAFAEWFCGLLGDPEFQADYERARRRYVRETRALFAAFHDLPNITSYPSRANFALIELDRSAAEVVGALLVHHGIYVRDCADKQGLDGNRFIRVAARTQEENRTVLHGLRSVLERPARHPLSPVTHDRKPRAHARTAISSLPSGSADVDAAALSRSQRSAII
jgi:histidinol-phosphate/aromatic aminotransferase/cobyric acid decarboxylase-like protein